MVSSGVRVKNIEPWKTQGNNRCTSRGMGFGKGMSHYIGGEESGWLRDLNEFNNASGRDMAGYLRRFLHHILGQFRKSPYDIRKSITFKHISNLPSRNVMCLHT